MTDFEFQEECNRLLAGVGVEASESMPIEKRIMLCNAIAGLFPVGSAERQEAELTAGALRDAEKSQLRLSNLLKP